MSGDSSLPPFLDGWFSGESSERLTEEDLNSRRAHVQRLVTEHGIGWEEAAIPFLEAEGSIDPAERFIRTPIVDTEIAYFTALHEIGHVVLDLPSFGPGESDEEPERRLYSNEASVWEWALDEAEAPPSLDAAQTIDFTLLSDEPAPSRADAVQRVRRKLDEVRGTNRG
jgi:hypothetical protein